MMRYETERRFQDALDRAETAVKEKHRRRITTTMRPGSLKITGFRSDLDPHRPVGLHTEIVVSRDVRSKMVLIRTNGVFSEIAETLRVLDAVMTGDFHVTFRD